MYSRGELIVIAVALTAACCIVGSAMYLSSINGERGDGAVTDDDYIGCWYLVQTVRSYNDGTVMDVSVGDGDDSLLSYRSLYLFNVDSGLVYGTYHDEGITGYVLGNQALFYFEKHGRYTSCTGYLSDGFLVLVNAHGDLDADGESVALCAGISVYSKDPARPLMDMSGICPDLSGEWKVSFSRVVTQSHTTESDVTGLNIDWMKGGVFTGTVSLDRGGVTTEVGVKGSLAPCGDVYSGLMSEIEYGGVWGATYHDGILRVATSDLDSMGGEAGGEEVVFTRDGSERQIETIPQSMLGTSWITTSSKTITADGARASDGNEYVLDFDELTGDLIHGKSAYGTRSADAYVYYLCDAGDGKHRLQVSWDAFHSTLIHGTGIYADGKLYFVECYVSEDGTPITSATVLEQRTANLDVEFLGHWYTCYSVGYNSVKGYTESSYADSPDLATYDIDVLKYDDGLIYGEYMGQGISASYSNGFVNMDMLYPEGDMVKTVRGWFDNDVMVLMTAITGASNDQPSQVYYTAYSKVRSPLAMNTPDIDLSGLWTSESYTEYLMDGSVKDLGHVDMKITDVKKNVFTGTLGGSHYSGIYLNVHGGIAGITADELGRQWYVTSDGESIRANTIDGSLNDNDMIGDVCVVLVRDGSHGKVDVPDLSGKTYESSGIRVQYNDGSAFVLDRPGTLTIEGQHGNCIIGQAVIEGVEFDVIGSVFWINGTLVVRISLQNGPDPYGTPLGYLTFRDGATMLSLHTMSGKLSATGVAEMAEVVS